MMATIRENIKQQVSGMQWRGDSGEPLQGIYIYD
jgi:hypothetical protein